MPQIAFIVIKCTFTIPVLIWYMVCTIKHFPTKIKLAFLQTSPYAIHYNISDENIALSERNDSH